MVHKDGHSHTLLTGTLILTAAGIVVKVIGSLNWIFLSRVLGGEGIGLYQMAFPIYLLALSVSSAGIPVAISIITAEKVALRDYRGAWRVFRISLLLLTVSGLLLSALVFFGADWLVKSRLIRDSRAYYSLIALSPAIFFVTILSSYRGYLQGWQMMTPTAVSQIAEQVFRVVTMLVFAYLLLPMGLDYAAAGASLGAAPGAVAGLAVLVLYYWKLDMHRRCHQPDQLLTGTQESSFAIIKRLAILALPVSLASIMLPLVSNLDLLIVPLRLEAAGYRVEQATELFGYLTGMAVPLVNLSTILTAALATSIVPAVAMAVAVGNQARVHDQTMDAIRIANGVTIPATVVLWLLAEPIADIVYHAPQAARSIEVMAGAVFWLGLHQVSTGVLQGLGRTKIPVINMGISAVVKVILNWTLTAVPFLGIQGASLATVADIGVAALLNLYFINRYVGLRIDVAGLLKMLFSAATMGGGLFFTYQGISHHGGVLLATVVAMGMGAVVYGLLMVLTGAVSVRDVRRAPFVGQKMAVWLERCQWLRH